MQNSPVLTPAQPLPFLQAMAKAITGPNTVNFRALAQNPKATAGQGFLWIAIGSAISSLISGVLFAIFPNNPLQSGPLIDLFNQYSGIEIPRTYNVAPSIFSVLTTLICGIPLGVVVAVIVTAILAGLIHLMASLLGGHGDYGKLVYMLALVQVPFGLIGSILTPIPYLGCLSFLIGLYALVLEVLAIEGVYLFGVAKAALTLLIPVIVICLVLTCLLVGIISIFGIAIRDAFQNMPQGFPSP